MGSRTIRPETDFAEILGGGQKNWPPMTHSRHPASRESLALYLCSPHGLIIPREKGILFSVCLSVRLSGTPFFSFCARNSSYSFHHTQTKPIPSESWMSGVSWGGQFFRTLQNFGEICLWKRPKITNSNFWSVRSQRVLGLERRYPYHMKALLL